MKEEVLHIDPTLKQTISPKLAWHYRILPKAAGDEIELYMDRERQVNGILKELEVVIGRPVKIFQESPGFIERALSFNYPRNHAAADRSGGLPRLLSNKESFISSLIEEALVEGSSDIHFEVREKSARIRFRVDGNLVDKYTVPVSDYPAMVNAIKIKSNLDIAEKRLPQDGRIFFKGSATRLDIRVSIVPTIHGEKVVFRLLNKDTTHIDLGKVGFDPLQLDHYQRGILRSNGLALISGPTGSGKTTTLYATLKRLNTKDRNILTIEDPIEYTLEGINQVQLKEDIGLTFPMALRTFLRQDPDIIMVGEIRDPETAQIAIRSALTGHLVLSTIHTNSAWGIVSRLIDMGVPGYLLAATLNVAVAQRLVRKLCPECKAQKHASNELRDQFFPEFRGSAFIPVGCPACNYSGFRGRMAIFEVIEINGAVRDLINQNELRPESLREICNYTSLDAQARKLFKDGLTSFDEVLPILLNQ